MTQYKNAKLIWADKLALGMVLFTALIWGAAWASAWMVIGDEGTRYLWLRLGASWTEIGVLGFVVAWLVMRAIDLCFGGATYHMMIAAQAKLASSARAVTRLAPYHGRQALR